MWSRFLVILFISFGCGCGPLPGTKGPAGPPGTDGATGPTGATGNTGPTGEEGHSAITASIGCFGPLAGTTLYFNYSAAVLSSGDVFAHAGISGDSFEIGGTSYWAATQVGAATAVVIFVYDISGAGTAGFWQIGVDRITAVTSIQYSDAGMIGGGASWTITPDKCIVNHY